MRRRARIVMIASVTWILAGCMAAPIESPGPLASATSSPAAKSGPSASAAAPSPSFAATNGPPASGPISQFESLPIALREQAWVRIRRETDASGEITAVGIEMGLLGAGATTTERREGNGPLWGFAAGPYVALENPPHDDTQPGTLEIRDARDGSTVGSIRRVMIGVAYLDPIRKVAYVAARHPGGGVDIERISFDGRTATTLLRLGATFTPGGIPEDRYDMTLTQSGALVVGACDRADGCRLWHVDPGASTAGRPVPFASSKPGLCWIGAASDTVAVVFDADACTDNGDAPRPSHAVSLVDGSAIALPSRQGFSIRRVIESAGRTLGIVSQPDGPGTSSIGTIDLATRDETLLLAGVPTADVTSWPSIVPSKGVLPGSWILLETLAPDDTAASTPAAVLLDAGTGTAIALPSGTSGWQWY